MKKNILPVALFLIAIAIVFWGYRINAAIRASKKLTVANPSAGVAGKSAVMKDPGLFRAKVNNGSKRGGLPSQQMSSQAQLIAQEYTKIIYPAIKRFSTSYNVLPQSKHFPQLSSFASQPDYQQWQIGGASRLDGSSISRDIYSHNPPNTPHDFWAVNTQFSQTAGPWGKGFLIHGWDDGRITFDPLNKEYHVPNNPNSAPPGANGIPPTATQDNP